MCIYANVCDTSRDPNGVCLCVCLCVFVFVCVFVCKRFTWKFVKFMCLYMYVCKQIFLYNIVICTSVLFPLGYMLRGTRKKHWSVILACSPELLAQWEEHASTKINCVWRLINVTPPRLFKVPGTLSDSCLESTFRAEPWVWESICIGGWLISADYFSWYLWLVCTCLDVMVTQPWELWMIMTISRRNFVFDVQ